MKKSDSKSPPSEQPAPHMCAGLRQPLSDGRELLETRSGARQNCADLGGDALIRQAISCDICASEKKQTNHWFVANEQGGELRVTGWNSRNRLRPDTKHLCGQTCLHKLVDEFMARTIAVRVQTGVAEEVILHQPAYQAITDTDASLTADSAYLGVESSARLVARPETVSPGPVAARPLPLRVSAELVAMPARPPAGEPAPPSEPQRYASRNWRAEAWDREREREMRAVERRPEASPRRRSGS